MGGIMIKFNTEINNNKWQYNLSVTRTTCITIENTPLVLTAHAAFKTVSWAGENELGTSRRWLARTQNQDVESGNLRTVTHCLASPQAL